MTNARAAAIVCTDWKAAVAPNAERPSIRAESKSKHHRPKGIRSHRDFGRMEVELAVHNRVRRLRRLNSIKWLGTGTCVLTIISWIASTRWLIVYVGDRWQAGIGEGHLTFGWYGGSSGIEGQWAFGSGDGSWGWYLPSLTHFGGGGPSFDLPFWFLFFLLAIPTAYVWLLHEPCSPFACCKKCGYRLEGLTEPRCPECSTEFDAKLLSTHPGSCSQEANH